MDLIRRYYLAVGGDRSLPVQHEGFGTLNFIVIALIQVLLLQPDAAGIVVLIEEPEIGLHPQAQRLLFRKLAEVYKHTGNQLIISTHSPNVALMWHQSDFRHKITRLVKRSIQEGTQVIPTPNIETSGGEATAPNTLKKIVRQHMMTLGGDVFFADKVVIVEGATELGALPLLAQRLDYDFEANNISVVMAGGANSMPTLASMCRDLNIPCLVLYDLDIFVRDGSLARKLNTKSDEYMKLKAALAKLGSPKEKASEDEIDKATTALTNLGWNPTKDDVSDFLSKFKTRDKLSGLVPTAEEMTAINDILFTANAWALPMDFEEAFLEHYPPSDYDDIRTLIKNIYDKTDCEQYRDQLNSDESNKKYKKCMAELLKRTCKNEYFWRIFLSGTLPNGSGWIHPELVRFIKKLKEL